MHILDVQTGEEVGQPRQETRPMRTYIPTMASGLSCQHWSCVPAADRDPIKLKGERVFQVVDAHTLEILKKIDMKVKLEEAGYPDLSPAVRPMAHTPDERYFYFQLSFLHGFIEYDMLDDRITRLATLPNLVPDMPIERYLNDSAHHGIAMNDAGDTLCVAGTMSIMWPW